MARDGEQREFGTADAPGTAGTSAADLNIVTGKGAGNVAGVGGSGGSVNTTTGDAGAGTTFGGAGGSRNTTTGTGGAAPTAGTGGDENTTLGDGGAGVAFGGTGGSFNRAAGNGGLATIGQGGTGGQFSDVAGSGANGPIGGDAGGIGRTAGNGGNGAAGNGGAGGSIVDQAGDAGTSFAGFGNVGGSYTADAGLGSGTLGAGSVNLGLVKADQVNIAHSTADTVVGGTSRVPVVATAIGITLDKSAEVIEGTAGAGGITIALPTAAGIPGRRYAILKVDSAAGAVTVDAAGAESINGSLTQLLTTQWDCIVIVANQAGTGWEIISDTRAAEVITGNVVPKVFADSTYTALPSDWLIKYDATGGASTVALPTAVGIKGKQYIVKKIDATANTVTIDANGAQTIDGMLTAVLIGQWDVITLVSDGANWMTV
jgi:hypothetical protein